MSGPYIPLGQNLPSAAANTRTKLPQTQKINSDSLSFQNVLNQQQASAAHIKANVPPAGARSSTFSVPEMQPSTSTFGQPSVIPPESMEMVNKYGGNMPNNSQLEQVMLQNMKDYQAMKQQDNNNVPATIPQQNLSAPVETKSQPSNANFETSMNNGLQQAFAGGRQELPEPQLLGSVPAPKTSAKSIAPEQPEAKQSQDSAPQDKTGKSKTGFFSAIGNFFKDVASGLTFGIYTPEGEPKPKGIDHLFHPFKKLAFDAPIKDLAIGVPTGAYHSLTNSSEKNAPKEKQPNQEQNVTRKSYRERFAGSSTKPLRWG